MDLSPSLQPDPAWSTAVPDWQDRIRAGKSLVPDLPLFDSAARKGVEVFKRLRIPDMIGTPTFGETCEPWVIEFVEVIFGCYDPETKKRMLREFFLMVPKKNTKSSIAAGIAVTSMILNERPNAEIWLVAPTKNIAEIIFSQASGMVLLDLELKKIFKVRDHKKQIDHLVTDAEMKIVAADTDVATGSTAAIVIVDETHVLGSKEKAAGVFLEIRGGLAARPEGFFLQITTQSKARPKGQFKKELQKARQVRDGEIRQPVLAVLYEFPEDVIKSQGWQDPACWSMVNPNLERSVSLQYLIDQFETAKRDGADDVALFASQHLNVEIGGGLLQDRWVGAQLWAPCADPSLTFDALIARSEVIVAGVDGGGMDDLLGLALIGRDKESKKWLAWARAWAQPIVLERRKSIAPDLRDLADAGDLVICETPTQDIDGIVEIISQVMVAGLLADKNAIGLDPMGVAAILDALIEAGVSEDQLRAVSQGYRLNGAIKGTERKLMDGSLVHGDQPIMSFSVSNAATEQSGNATIVTKAASGTAKIDPLMAVFNAVTLMSLNPTATQVDISGFLNNPVQVI